LARSVATFGVTMNFEWDEAKNRTNIRKHGFNLGDAQQMFLGPLLVRPDLRQDYGEDRWLGIGVANGRIAFVALTSTSSDTIRIISLRKANHAERKEYEEALQNGLEAH